MKQLFRFSILLLALLLPATASAYDFEVDGIYYNINGNDVTVTYQSYSNFVYSSDYSGDVTIPETVTYGGTTYSVTSIGDYAFSYCSGLTSITMPNSVTSIGGCAFDYCIGLTSIIIPDSVTSIGNNAFTNCSGLTSITIPQSVTQIGVWAFSGCSGLTDLIWNARNCDSNGEMYRYNIERVTIGNEVEVLPMNFVSNSKITSVTIPNSVTSIYFAAFSNCSGLTGVTIPNSVKIIGPEAFKDCQNLTSVTIPNSVTTIHQDAFSGTAWYNNQPDLQVQRQYAYGSKYNSGRWHSWNS